eukprot:Gb_19947 [translate_table: standard]
MRLPIPSYPFAQHWSPDGGRNSKSRGSGTKWRESGRLIDLPRPLLPLTVHMAQREVNLTEIKCAAVSCVGWLWSLCKTGGFGPVKNRPGNGMPTIVEPWHGMATSSGHSSLGSFDIPPPEDGHSGGPFVVYIAAEERKRKQQQQLCRMSGGDESAAGGQLANQAFFSLNCHFGLGCSSVSQTWRLDRVPSKLVRDVVIPEKATDTYLSMIGHLDNRVYLNGRVLDVPPVYANVEAGSRFCADLCIMASKLVYENENVVKNAVTNNWKMHFVDFFNFWNGAPNPSMLMTGSQISISLGINWSYSEEFISDF